VDQFLPLKPKPISLDELKRQRLQSNAESSPTKKIKITDEKDTAPSPRSPQGGRQIHFLVFESIDSQASSLRKKRIQSYLEKVFVCPHISQKYFAKLLAALSFSLTDIKTPYSGEKSDCDYTPYSDSDRLTTAGATPFAFLKP
jgi:hypothetical protein